MTLHGVGVTKSGDDEIDCFFLFALASGIAYICTSAYDKEL